MSWTCRRSSSSPPDATVTSTAELPFSATPTVATRCVRLTTLSRSAARARGGNRSLERRLQVRTCGEADEQLPQTYGKAGDMRALRWLELDLQDVAPGPVDEPPSAKAMNAATQGPDIESRHGSDVRSPEARPE